MGKAENWKAAEEWNKIDLSCLGFLINTRKIEYITMRLVRKWNRCAVRLWNLYYWRYSELKRTWSWIPSGVGYDVKDSPVSRRVLDPMTPAGSFQLKLFYRNVTNLILNSSRLAIMCASILLSWLSGLRSGEDCCYHFVVEQWGMWHTQILLFGKYVNWKLNWLWHFEGRLIRE